MTRVLFLIVGIMTALTCTVAMGAQEASVSQADNEVYMVQGEVTIIKTSGATRLSITHPEVADIIKVSDEGILIAAQGIGDTALFIWEGKVKRAVTIFVFSRNLELIRGRMERLFKTADITEIELKIDGKEGKVVISGYIPNHKKERFDQIVESFSNDVLNLVKEDEIEDLIEVAIQITELSTTLAKSLGFEWFTGTHSLSSGNLTTTSSGGFTPTYGEIFPSLDGSVGDYFKIGQFERTVNSSLIMQINALIQQGKARILSQPKLVVKSGEEASFLVGGEIPIRTTTSTQSGGTQENVQFKEYGINMTITPEIKKEKIDLTMSVEISDIDAANAVGSNVAFTTRSAQTKLYLDNGQTIVLAGLIKQNRSVKVKKVPFLGDIPVVGVLFRTKLTPTDNQDQELVITLTPTVLQRNRSGDKPVMDTTEDFAIDEVDEAQEIILNEEINPVVIGPESVAEQPSAPRVEPAKQSEAPSEDLLFDEVDAVSFQQPEVSLEGFAVDGADEVQEDASSQEMAVIAKEPEPPAKQSPAPSAESSQPLKALSSEKTPDVQQETSDYVNSVRQRIAQAIIYPQEAEQNGWEGTVRLTLLILKDGTLVTAIVRESSGHKILDDHTLSTAKKLAPYSSLPASSDIPELNVTIPIVYSLKKG